MASSLQIVKQFFPNVKKVNDGDEPLEIEITREDNTKSRVQDHNGCAMAVACKRKFKLDGVIISIDRAYMIRGNTATRYTVPQSVQREIVSFDRKAGFRVGNYHLAAVSKSNRIGSHRGPHGDNKTRGSGRMKKRFHHITDGIRAALGSKHAPDLITRTEGQ